MMKKIVCLGDSITCNWESPSYVDYWQELFEKNAEQVQVISAGINGETAQDGYYRTRHDVLEHKPNLVTIMFGHNEVRMGIKPIIFENYLRKIVNLVRHETDADIWLLSINQLGDVKQQEMYEPYIEAIQEAAHDKQVKYVNLWNIFNEDELPQIFTYEFDAGYIGQTGRDWVHPNEIGLQKIAQILFAEYHKEKR